nr:YqeG family HAD IIIA-type phosphatase [Pyrobaculum sp.]
MRSESSIRLLRPDEEARSLQEVDFQGLREKGIKVLLFDLDNTLCPWRAEELPLSTAALLRALQAQGFKLAVLTNARLPRDSPVRRALAELGVLLMERAMKPLPFSFRRAGRAFGAAPRAVAVIGDQLLTDVLGGKFAGLYTVLVPPLSPHEARRTKVNRVIEGLLGRRV